MLQDSPAQEPLGVLQEPPAKGPLGMLQDPPAKEPWGALQDPSGQEPQLGVALGEVDVPAEEAGSVLNCSSFLRLSAILYISPGS